LVPIIPLAVTVGENLFKDLECRLPTLAPDALYILPDLSAIGPEASERLLSTLSLFAERYSHSYLVGLTLFGVHLAGANPSAPYRMAMLTTPAGVSYAVAGLNSEPERSALAAYDYWWRVPMVVGREQETMMVILGSDVLYLIAGFQANLDAERNPHFPSNPEIELPLADWLVVLGDLPQGSVRAATAILEMAVECSWTRASALVNAGRASAREASRQPWLAIDWSPEALPDPNWAYERRWSLFRRHGAFVPDRYLAQGEEAIWEWTEDSGGRVAMALSRAASRPQMAKWPFGPVLLSLQSDRE